MAELADRVHRLRLPRLQVADEVPPERVAVDLVLGGEILRAVLPHHLDARLRKRCELGDRHVLRRDDDGDARTDLGPHALVSLAQLVR